MGAQSAQAQDQAVDVPDGFGVAVVREDGKWRCTPMRRAALTSLSAAETELRELRSAGAVFGLLDVDDEFFVIVRPAPSGTRLLLSDATAALDYDIAAEVLEKLDADIERRGSRTTPTRSRRATSGCCPTSGCPRRCSASSSTRRRPLRRRAAGPDRAGDGVRRRAVGGARPPRVGERPTKT